MYMIRKLLRRFRDLIRCCGKSVDYTVDVVECYDNPIYKPNTDDVVDD